MKKQEPSRKAFKDWFDDEAVEALGQQVAAVGSQFDLSLFRQLAGKGLGSLEFLARVKQFSHALHRSLPKDPPVALAILRNSLPTLMPDCESVTDGWLQWPIGQFIADHGLEHFEESFVTMIELTQRFSSEFAVRPFLSRYPDATFERLLSLTDHQSAHVRRWCSEGVRTRLPWGKRLDNLIANPEPIWEILERLKGDPELYVRRSVANNLNDLAKDHPEAVVERCRRWAGEEFEGRDWVLRQALRSLVKDGHKGALSVLGYHPPAEISAELSLTPEELSVGESTQMRCELSSGSSRAQLLQLDYAVHYIRQKGKTSAKVFKWKSLELEPGQTVTLHKKHSMKATTIRALYPGTHKVELQLNGERVAESSFLLA